MLHSFTYKQIFEKINVLEIRNCHLSKNFHSYMKSIPLPRTYHLVDTVSKVIFLKVETMGTLQYVHVSRLLLQNESSTGEPKVDTYIKYGSCLATTTCYFSKNCLFKLWMYVSVYDKSDLEITLCNYLVNCIFRWNFWTSLKDMFVHTFERQSKWFAFEILSRKNSNFVNLCSAVQYIYEFKKELYRS